MEGKEEVGGVEFIKKPESGSEPESEPEPQPQPKKNENPVEGLRSDIDKDLNKQNQGNNSGQLDHGSSQEGKGRRQAG